MNCFKCGDALGQKEIDVGKEKCTTCLVRGYKFAMGKAFRERDKAIEELNKLKKLKRWYYAMDK